MGRVGEVEKMVEKKLASNLERYTRVFALPSILHPAMIRRLEDVQVLLSKRSSVLTLCCPNVFGLGKIPSFQGTKENIFHA